MKLEKIRNTIENSIPEPIDIFRKYSVLIPIIEVEGELHLLYEIRSKKLKTQPGEICFPGGGIEKGEDPISAALRETSEELLISKSEIEVYGEGDYLVNPYNRVIYSVVAKINKDLSEINPNRSEVDQVFTVPLSFFLKDPPKSYEVEFQAKRNKLFPYELIPNGKNYKFGKNRDRVLFYNYKGLIIWGFTAKMTYNFLKKVGVQL
ncbi:NUDIX hydrolase [Peptoniphilus catoniae]|uniref:NUDIX hydrolase n=1 Tax=Peptoniphilus catoniae TaxID=1660341 RepID=UPI0010FCEF65|nr:CoA pyrophosphatase [Peptoniphilus catoniae]